MKLVLELPTVEWFRRTRNDTIARSLLKDGFAEGTPQHEAAEAWVTRGAPMSADQAHGLIAAALERLNVAYLGVDADRIVENLFLQGLLPTLPVVPRLNEAERRLEVPPVSFQDLFAVILETTALDRLVIDIATEMFPGYVFDPCQPSFEAFAETARRYGLEDTDSGHVR